MRATAVTETEMTGGQQIVTANFIGIEPSAFFGCLTSRTYTISNGPSRFGEELTAGSRLAWERHGLGKH